MSLTPQSNSSFFRSRLNPADLDNHEKLLDKLTPDILQSAYELFAVRLVWLEGVDQLIYETHNFYKHPEDYGDFLAQLVADVKHRTIATLVLSTDLVWEEQFDDLDNESVVRQHLCSGWVNKYWKSRADLTACIAMTLKQPVYIKVLRTSSKIVNFGEGTEFLSDLCQLLFAF